MPLFEPVLPAAVVVSTVSEASSPMPSASVPDKLQGVGVLTGVIVAQGEDAVGQEVDGWPSPTAGTNFLDDTASGIAVVFGEDGNAAIVTGDGWSEPESGHIWTASHRSTLLLPQPPKADRFELRLELVPFAAEPALPTQQIRLTVNDQPVAPLRIADHVVVAVELPGDVVARHEQVELVFDLPDAARPVDVTGFPDDRLLGLSFRRLALLPIPASG